MVRVVAVRVVTWRLLTGPGGVASERVVTAMVGVVGGAVVGRAGEKQNKLPSEKCMQTPNDF